MLICKHQIFPPIPTELNRLFSEEPFMMSTVSTTYLSLGHGLSVSASFHKKENHSHLEIKTACKNNTT